MAYLFSMLPLLSPAQVREMDRSTMDTEPISSLGLMERAAHRCADRILEAVHGGAWGPPHELMVTVLIGMGNNGGDGAVIARLLHGAGIKVRAVRIRYKDEATADNQVQWERCNIPGLERMDGCDAAQLFVADRRDLVIDALFGIGFKGPLPKVVVDVIHAVEGRHLPVVAIDMPSGMCTETPFLGVDGACMPAQWTLTFEVPKLPFLLPEHERYVGHWEVVRIGFDHERLRACSSEHYMLESRDLRDLIKPRSRFAHKGTFGHALLIAGSEGRCGAAILAAQAALRSGAGLVTVRVPRVGLAPLQTACPEAMALVDDGPAERITDAGDLGPFGSIGLGPGLGSSADTALVVKQVLQRAMVPVVLDADALNALAHNPTWMEFLPRGTVLTPHPKEFDRLASRSHATGEERLHSAREMAVRHGCTVVLKGAWTAICSPDGRTTFSPTGGPGMARGGSGDALTGLLTGIMAQGFDPIHAAYLAVYLHGAAGDLAAARKGETAMTVGDLIAALPEAWEQLRNEEEEP